MRMGKPKISRTSLRALGLATLSVILGLGWTVSSGLSESPDEVVTRFTNVELALPYRGVCSDLDVLRGEQEVALGRKSLGGGLALISFHLEPGRHNLTLRFTGPVPGLDRLYPLTVTVDQVPPTLEAQLDGPDVVDGAMTTTAEAMTLRGATEAEAAVHLEGEEIEKADDGTFEVERPLAPGWNHLLLSATDPAGNRKRLTYSVFRDVEEPRVSWRTKPDEVFSENTARLELDLWDDGSIAGISAKVDGEQPVEWYAKGGGYWVGKTGELHEGFHEVAVKVADASGRVSTSTRQIVIDSSETLGEAPLGLGARGEDVRALHERLAEAGHLPKEAVKDVFDKTTEQAVKKLQKAEGFEVTGLAEGETLIALGPRIFINLSKFSLVLDLPGQGEKRWNIASGSPEFPTPRGEYRIVEKVIDPTWLPPKSDWAKDAKPIPPGPNNPLGTRWLGFDWGGVGIHGTNAPWTVGTAASHGCMRMVTGEVEELFELVEVGTPVTVLGGWEEDPVLERYWPTNPPEEVAGR